jgi:mono/diheme cytochrome c family protein
LRVVTGDAHPVFTIQPPRDPAHLRMLALPVDKEIQLPQQVAAIQSRQPRHEIAVSFALHSMARVTGPRRPGIPAGKGDKFTGILEAAGHRLRIACRNAGRRRYQAGQSPCIRSEPFHPKREHSPTRLVPLSVSERRVQGKSFKWVWLMAAISALAGCRAPPEGRKVTDDAAKQRGLALIKETGCGACHEIPGVDWPRGKLGPSLVGFDDTGLIAGALPHTAGTLAAFVRNAPAVKPGSTMPQMPITESEAADIAAYLYGVGND